MPELDATEFGTYQRCWTCREWLPFDAEFFARVRTGIRRGELSDVCRVCSGISAQSDARSDHNERLRAARRPAPRPCRSTDAIAALIGGPAAWR